VVKVALRTRESLALIRPRGDLLVMDTMLWPDEVRDSQFAEPPTDVKATQAEVGMAEMFIEQMSGEWRPDDYSDQYRIALEELVQAKLSGVELPKAPASEGGGGEVVDLMAALRASVDAAKKRRDAAPKSDADQPELAEAKPGRRRKAS